MEHSEQCLLMESPQSMSANVAMLTPPHCPLPKLMPPGSSSGLSQVPRLLPCAFCCPGLHSPQLLLAQEVSPPPPWAKRLQQPCLRSCGQSSSLMGMGRLDFLVFNLNFCSVSQYKNRVCFLLSGYKNDVFSVGKTCTAHFLLKRKQKKSL